MRWHVYGVTVEPTEIVYRIDGKVVARAPQVDGGDKPMFLLIDLGVRRWLADRARPCAESRGPVRGLVPGLRLSFA